MGTRALSAFATVAAMVIIVPPAGGKDWGVASVCGTGHCLTLRGEKGVAPLLAWQDGPFVTRTAPAPAAYYAIRVHDGFDIHWTLLYVPSQHAIRISQSRVLGYEEGVAPYWRALPSAAEAALRHAVSPLRPLAAPRVWPA
jgi:hypothetical protein